MITFALRIHPAAVSGLVFVIRAGGFDKPAFRSRGACPICPLSEQSTPVRLPPPVQASVFFRSAKILFRLIVIATMQTMTPRLFEAGEWRRHALSTVAPRESDPSLLVHARVINDFHTPFYSVPVSGFNLGAVGEAGGVF